jgi:psiF repeat-containing protein
MRIAVSAFLALMIGSASALAQAPAAPAKMTPEQKQAISKSCTDQANAKGLHGKERKKFRSECKHNAGKPQ